eukprot:354664-Chlamydomonas_euryale.AAC.4
MRGAAADEQWQACMRGAAADARWQGSMHGAAADARWHAIFSPTATTSPKHVPRRYQNNVEMLGAVQVSNSLIPSSQPGASLQCPTCMLGDQTAGYVSGGLGTSAAPAVYTELANTFS